MRALTPTRLTAAITVTALAAGSCSSGDPGLPVAGSAPPSFPAPATSPAGSADQGARDEVLNRYRGYVVAYTRAQLAADPQDEELLSYLEAPLKQRVIAFLTQTRQNGAAYRGEPTSRPQIAAIDLSAKTPTALVSDCFDATGFRLYYTSTNKPVPINSGPRRYIIETTATDYGERGWLFTTARSLPERTC